MKYFYGMEVEKNLGKGTAKQNPPAQKAVLTDKLMVAVEYAARILPTVSKKTTKEGLGLHGPVSRSANVDCNGRESTRKLPAISILFCVKRDVVAAREDV